jgi:phosphohistidine phosphatase
MMHLYLVQHAQAKSEDEDAQRPLSERGVADLRKITGFLDSHAGFDVKTIFYSGRLRAKQTAEWLAMYVRATGGIHESDGLAPNDDPGIWAQRLRDHIDDLMLVGHLPHLQRLASLLLGGDPSRPLVHFANGGIVCLARDLDGNWSVRWMIIPEVLL